MNNKTSLFDFDWWVVQKRVVYLLVSSAIVLIVTAGGSLLLWKYGSPFKSSGNSLSALSGARFISFEGDVRVVRAATRETLQATIDTQLHAGDTVQTQADGRARISLADGSSMVVGPNSIVIIRDNTLVEGTERTNVNVVVDRGQIKVRTEVQAEGASNVVETRQTKNRIGAETGASFGVNPDNTEDIRVNSGSVETTTVKTGERITLRGGEYVAINPAGSVARREKLLDVPLPSQPRELERVSVGSNGAANVLLRWQRPGFGVPTYYRVEVATSPFFVPAGKVIERDQLAATEFNATDLRPGNYFWRVRATASSGQTSDWSEAQKFIVVPRGSDQSVSVSNITIEYVAGNVYLVRGRSQPGVTIRISGRETLAASDGSFQIQVAARDGNREITLEAQDPQGNRSQYPVHLPVSQVHPKT